MGKYELIVGHGTTIVDSAAGLIVPRAGGVRMSVDAPMMRNGSTDYHDELQYLSLLQQLVDKADADPTPRADRTGTGTYSVFGRQLRFDLTKSFPLLTTKKVNFKAIVAELLWFLSGSTNTKDLDSTIWDQWAGPNGECGPIYGEQWRFWASTRKAMEVNGEIVHGTIDQMRQLLINLREKPNDRGHVVSAWNPVDLPDMALRPCHCLFQFYVDGDKLSCQLYQRSGDIFLGVPFNIASYALLTHLIARAVGLKPGEFVHTFGDVHLYANHVDQAREQLTRCPRPFPTLDIVGDGELFNVEAGDIHVDGYDPHPAIKAEVSI